MAIFDNTCIFDPLEFTIFHAMSMYDWLHAHVHHVHMTIIPLDDNPFHHHSIGWPPISPSFHWMTHPFRHHLIGWPPISQSYHWMTTHLTIIPLDDHPSHNHTIGWPPISPSSKSSHVCIRILMGGPFGHNFDVQYIKCLPHSHTNGIVSAFRNPN
jgi:hypothetical protein